MEAGFDYLEREGIEPSVVVTLTDGYDSYTQAPNFPVVWCVSSDQVPPYGEVVHFEMEM
jgi:predicted metal-dependent peptidase